MSYRRRLKSLLSWCYVFRALINSLVFWFCELKVFCVSRRQYFEQFHSAATVTDNNKEANVKKKKKKKEFTLFSSSSVLLYVHKDCKD